MLNISAHRLNPLPFEKCGYRNRNKIGKRYYKKVVITNCQTPLAIQQVMHKTLNATRRAVKTSQKVKRTFGCKNRVRGVNEKINNTQTYYYYKYPNFPTHYNSATIAAITTTST